MNSLIVLNEQHSILHQYLSEIRNTEVQQDRLRFRRNMERIGAIMAYEISKTFEYQTVNIQTPLKETQTKQVAEDILIISILRAAIPLAQGFMEIFDHADQGFIGAYRTEDAKEITIAMDYSAMPKIEGKTVILVDPMLATGKSMVKTVNQILKKGTPSSLHIASVISAPEGIEYLEKQLTVEYHLWTAAVDERLNDKAYIVPGLGDAGDLAFGEKS